MEGDLKEGGWKCEGILYKYPCFPLVTGLVPSVLDRC